MAPDREEDRQGDGVTILWTDATAPYQNLSGSLKTGRRGEKLAMLSLDSTPLI